MSTQIADEDIPWWRGALIYQIYPRSFYDSNQDGIGDLAGITAKLPYLTDLGVEAVWISPFFESPMQDFGYDISDYRSIDPIFGGMSDFEHLISSAHQAGLKVIIDQVLSHTSDQHAWFEASRQCRNNDKADWYVWADPLADGTPPNNWLSLFGGSAWKWDSVRRQYYLHNFLECQPDLNFHNPEVRQAQLDNVKFWLEKGVDGVRLDVVNFYYHDVSLRSNPPVTQNADLMLNARADNPYVYQEHKYDIDQDENLAFLAELRQTLDDYPGTTSIGEISSRQGLQRMAEYTDGNQRLHMAYTFELLSSELSAHHVVDVIESGERLAENGWPCWAIGNHDVDRFFSRWGGQAGIERVALALLFAMRGSLCFYQGDELALPQAQVDDNEMRDPYGLNFAPMFRGRDGCRTPMVWEADQPYAGFSDAKPWLTIPDDHLSCAVDTKLTATDSSLQLTKALVNLRKSSTALRQGSVKVVDYTESMVLIEREWTDNKIAVAINFKDTNVTIDLPYTQAEELVLPGIAGDLQGQRLVIGPRNALYMTI